VLKAPDLDTLKEIDWVYCEGFQGGFVNPTGIAATTLFLFPASYVMRVAYGGRYRLANQKKRPSDVGYFAPIHRAPDAALSLLQVSEIIARLQIQEGAEAPLLYDNFVRDVSDRFEQALARIKTTHNFEFGTEFEIAICKTLRHALPQKYGICRGYVVSDLGEKAGDDVIIYDRMRFPTLRALETDDFSCKEHVPSEAVYAYIEAKHSICIEGDGPASFQKALTQVGQVKMLCDRRASVTQLDDNPHSRAARLAGWPEIRNPAYGVIICRHVRFKDRDPNIDDPEEIQRHLLAAHPHTLLPPDFCVFGKSNMLIPVVPSEDRETTSMPSPFFLSGRSSMNSRIVRGVGFGAGLSLLLWALDWIQLGEMPWPTILEDCIPPSD
jgi:hypothetical protein